MSGGPASPRNWAWATLGDVTFEKVPQMGPTGEQFTYIDISSVDNSLKRIVAPKRLPTQSAPSRARQNFTTGDVLVSMTRPNLNAVALVPADLDGAVGSTGFDVLRVMEMDPRWVYYAVQTDKFVEAMVSLVQGALYPAVRPNDVRSFAIPVPPLAEQRRIVAETEKQFTRLEAAEAALLRARANLKRYSAAVLKAAYEGRLVPTEAELARAESRPFEPAQTLRARIAQERGLGHDSRLHRATPSGARAGVHSLRGGTKAVLAPATESAILPDGWCWSTFGDLFRVDVGATPRRSRPEYWNGNIPWVSSGEVAFCRIRDSREKITPSGLRDSSTCLHPPGTVLLGMIGEGKTRGQAAILEIPACNNQNSAAIRVSESGIPPEYVFRFLESRYEQTRVIGSGNNQPALNKARVESIQIPLPPLAEQHRIVAEVERRLSVVEQLEAAVEANLQRAGKLRQAILKHAFEGKLVPQDPNDEPASLLLKRIRRQRAQQETTRPARRRRRPEDVS